MKRIEKSDIIQISTKKYNVTISKERNIFKLELPDSRYQYHMPMMFACNVRGLLDYSIISSEYELSEHKNFVRLFYSEKSTLWERKEIIIIFKEESFSVSYQIFGSGKVDTAYFFRGFKDNKEYGCAPEFDKVFTAAPNFLEKHYFHPSDYITINSFHSAFSGGSCLASPYYFYALNHSSDSEWVGVGPVAKPGENFFESFEMNPKHCIEQTPWEPDNAYGGGFRLCYNGHLNVRGEYQFPEMLFVFGNSEWDTLRKHVTYQKNIGFVPEIERQIPLKWLEPIFCGWHEQGALVDFSGFRDDQLGSAINGLCTEANHLKWLDTLEKNNCKPGTIIIDDRWQKDTGNNINDPLHFPNMRRFIEERHKNGQLVFLWDQLWTKEGIPDAECIFDNGQPIAGDPTNPDYEKRIRKWVYRMFSADDGCYNADGIKIDSMLQIPGGPNIQINKNVFGLELQKYILSIIHDEAKRHKPDAVISVFSLHPYLGDVIDMVRIGDMYTIKASSFDTMLHRARLYKTLLPGIPIDTDGQFSLNMIDNWRNIFKYQAEIGIPTLYCATIAKRHRFFMDPILNEITQDDYNFFADVLKNYRKKLRVS